MAALAMAGFVMITSGCGLFLANERPRTAADSRPPAGCDAPVHAPFPLLGAPPDTLDRPWDGPTAAIEKAAPEYPAIARQANVDGTVVMDVLVCEHGRVVDARVVKSIAMLDASALDAVRRWKFRRAMRNGQPVARWTTIPMKFTLN